MWRVLENKLENKAIKPLHVITTDTLVENPVVATWVKTSLNLLRDKAKEKGLPIFPTLLTPNIEETFWVNLIGKGYPAPNTKFRWCTERMKIRPSDRFLRKISSESGESVLVIGTRKAESANRAISLENLKKATRENFQKHVNLVNVVSYCPSKIGQMMMCGFTFYKTLCPGVLTTKIYYRCIKEPRMAENVH